MVDVFTDSPQLAQNGASEPKEHRPPKMDDDDIAQQLVAEWRHSHAYIYQDWHIYQNGAWVKQSIEVIRRQAKEFMRRFKASIAINNGRITSVISLAQDDLAVEIKTLEGEAAKQRSRYVNLQNGLFNLGTLRLEAHRAELYFLYQLPFAYEPDARCPNFFKFLETSLVDEEGHPDRDMAVLLGEFCGYALTARTDLRKAALLIGATRSGKSTLITLMTNLLGDLHQKIDMSQIDPGKNRFMTANLLGKRLVTDTENPAGSVLPDAPFKTIVGGSDLITAEFKGKQIFHFTNEAKIMWGMNIEPRILDRSGAVYNRILPILFPRTIPENELIADLDEKLKAELPGIFLWFVSRYKILSKRGYFILPKRSQEWLEQYEKDQDHEAQFLKECCIRDSQAGIKAMALQRCYVDWCKDSGIPLAGTRNGLAREWRRLGLRSLERNNGTYWIGIRWNSEKSQIYANELDATSATVATNTIQ